MKAIFVHDTFYSRGPLGAVCSFGAFPYALWAERFLPHFESVMVIGRDKPFEGRDLTTAIRADGPGVDFLLLPNINTPSKRLNARPVINKVVNAVQGADAVIIRGPSEFGMIAAAAATKINVPIAIEMSGCAFDHTWYKSLTGKLYAPVKHLRARHMVKNSDCVAYVTENFLQERYPTNGTSVNASNVEIDTPSSIVLEHRLRRIEFQKSITFGLIGNYGNKLKGLDTAISALTRAAPHLPKFEIRVLGEGTPTSYASDFVKFYEPLTNKDDVLDWLDNVDIYLQPSLHEGLPRALIEAMSRACPALGSDAGGIPELLSPDNIHKRGNDKQLAVQILAAVNLDWQKRNAIANFKKSHDYTRPTLLPRREKFWQDFAALAEERRALKLAGQAEHKDILVEI